jgi:CubicO group peptidase (beta-lactamase class C family)
MSDGAIDGTCDDRFTAVRSAFERNFAEHGEMGASVCVTLDGESVVDLWGGTADSATGAAWQRDTIGVVWSCTKGATALCAHMLVSRGQLDLDAAVARYWPEFAAHGKQDVTVRMLLAHQAGLPAFHAPIPDDGYCDWNYVCERLAAGNRSGLPARATATTR